MRLVITQLETRSLHVLAGAALAAVLCAPVPVHAADAEKVPPIVDPSAATKSDCESYLPVLTGKKKGSAMLSDPKLGAVAKRSPDLIKCGAVAADSDELCKLLNEQDSDECRKLRFVYHDLKTNPKGRGFLMPDEDYETCRRELPKQKMPATLCDEFREAARAGDPSKCPKGDIAGMTEWCQAIVSLDKSKCMGIGKKEDKEQGKASCEKLIDRSQVFARGLKELAQSGSPLERALANAAQGKADACGAFAGDTVKSCADAVPTPKATPAEKAPAAPPAADGATPKQS